MTYPTNSSQSDILQVISPVLVKQTDWCYILGSPYKTRGNLFEKSYGVSMTEGLQLIIYVVGLIFGFIWDVLKFLLGIRFT